MDAITIIDRLKNNINGLNFYSGRGKLHIPIPQSHILRAVCRIVCMDMDCCIITISNLIHVAAFIELPEANTIINFIAYRLLCAKYQKQNNKEGNL